MFFFEKKNQKTFAPSGSIIAAHVPRWPASRSRSFLLPFFKMEVLASFFLLVSSQARSADPELSWDDMRNIITHQAGTQPGIEFPPAVKSLNGKPVTIAGWITPINLGDGTTVTSFLLTGTPGTCPFCFGYGPESFVLVTATEPVPADVTVELQLSGRFEISPNDPTGFYYRLRDAHITGHP